MKKVLLALLVLGVLAGAGAGGYLYLRNERISAFASQPFGSSDPKTVEIPTGTGPKALGAQLARAGVIADGELFYGYLRREKLAPKLKAGEYEFEGELTPVQVIDRLIAGQVKVYRFTIPEGLRVDEILPLLAASPLKLSQQKLEALAANKDFILKAGVPTSRIEGFLYPDTYTFTKGATEEVVLKKMVTRTLEEFAKADAARQGWIKLNLLETVTLASIIEKETGQPQERPHISCVFHNRLKQKMKLQTDPTVIYAMMLLRGKYVKNITSQDLVTPHPYSTYTSFGLPPGPIANPGAAAIRAALDPMECKSLYFVSRNDGSHIFCPDYDCHLAAVQKWQVEFHRKKNR